MGWESSWLGTVPNWSERGGQSRAAQSEDCEERAHDGGGPGDDAHLAVRVALADGVRARPDFDHAPKESEHEEDSKDRAETLLQLAGGASARARINEKLVFNRLPYAIQREICELMIGREVERLNGLGHNLNVEAATVETLVREGFHRTLGARPMRNTVDRFLQEMAATTCLS